MSKVLTLFCLAQAVMAQFQGQYDPYYNDNGRVQMLPRDDSLVNSLGPQGVATGRNALNVASNLAKNVFPATGPIVDRNGQVQTKWGGYALPNPQDADIVEKLLSATRDMIQRMPIVE